LASVFGLPDEVLGERVGAVVQIAPDDTVSEQELQQFVANSLAAYKVPARIWIRNEPLPTGATGKVLKEELKANSIACAC
jgi:acyl-CoA synthetase (AMP-forming)/AMP-acid ligase II